MHYSLHECWNVVKSRLNNILNLRLHFECCQDIPQPMSLEYVVTIKHRLGDVGE